MCIRDSYCINAPIARGKKKKNNEKMWGKSMIQWRRQYLSEPTISWRSLWFWISFGTCQVKPPLHPNDVLKSSTVWIHSSFLPIKNGGLLLTYGKNFLARQSVHEKVFSRSCFISRDSRRLCSYIKILACEIFFVHEKVLCDWNPQFSSFTIQMEVQEGRHPYQEHRKAECHWIMY